MINDVMLMNPDLTLTINASMVGLRRMKRFMEKSLVENLREEVLLPANLAIR